MEKTMTKLATMGTSSCATIAIQGFKGCDVELEKEYQRTGVKSERARDVGWFYDNILYPVEQKLGRTSNFPFSQLMDMIDESEMHSKFIIAVLNEYQQDQEFWPPLLEARGFKLIDTTMNDIGSLNFVYVRNNNRTEESPMWGEKK